MHPNLNNIKDVDTLAIAHVREYQCIQLYERRNL